ncbi:Hypothetical_protein [Hexamita inflata]|uniref:Hypothetical_protein n=1 Tax=Hexamita inflata TaxID=28002 RepID=A0AA86QAZ8_9EUKA|nr:Hypothetical protein HINF_LOCUS36460 [Hexamita inflata]
MQELRQIGSELRSAAQKIPSYNKKMIIIVVYSICTLYYISCILYSWHVSSILQRPCMFGWFSRNYQHHVRNRNTPQQSSWHFIRRLYRSLCFQLHYEQKMGLFEK